MNLAGLLCLLVALLFADASAAQDSGGTKPASESAPQIETIEGERIVAWPTAVHDDKIVLGSDPGRTIPIDEIVAIRFDDKHHLAVTWIGQDGRDHVGDGGSNAPNGIQDVKLFVNGLRPEAKIREIVIHNHRARVSAAWHYDSAGKIDFGFPIGLVRPDDGPVAHVFLEPRDDASVGDNLELVLTYDDGKTARSSFVATTKASKELTADPTTAAPTSATKHLAVTVLIERGDVLAGVLCGYDETSLKLQTVGMNEATVPLASVLGLRFPAAATEQPRRVVDQSLANPSERDIAIVIDQQGNPIAIEGAVEGIADGQLRFTYDGEVRRIRVARLAGVVFAQRPKPARIGRPYQVFTLTGDQVVSGTWSAIGAKGYELHTFTGAALQIPIPLVKRINVKNGRLAYLSDLEPFAVEEVPYFGRVLSFARNRGLTGGPLKMNGQTYAKGIAVHSRCVLTYALEGTCVRLKCLLGFDDSARGLGRVHCRILGDGRELFADADVRADQAPRELDIDVTGVEQLTLEVDFGENEDVGDRVIWARARVIRK